MGWESWDPASLLGLAATSDHASVVSITLFVALLCFCMVVGHLLGENRWTNESITALVIGLLTGVIIFATTKGKSSHILVFSEDLFFIYLLPPIIFNAGFQVKKKQFFRNFITITLFGAVGTLISFTTISLAIGAIFSATDSVCTLQVLNQDETPLLYSLVFGEGVVNDATSVVLFNAIQNFDLAHIDFVIFLQFVLNFFKLFITSTLLGALAGLLSAYIIKKLYFGRHSTDREVALMILMAYLSYMLSELLELSGILTVFFCGIVMSHYTWHNVTESSRITTKHAFATMSFIAETFLFLYVGMDAMDIEKWNLARERPGYSFSIGGILIALVFVGRAAFVFPLSFLLNLTKKSPNEKIPFKQQVGALAFIKYNFSPHLELFSFHVSREIPIWWAGLMRGAVSIALAYNQFAKSGHTQLRGNAIMITSTMIVVLFSTVVFGLLTKPIVRCLCSVHSGGGAGSEPTTPKSFLAPLLDGNGLGSELEASRQCIPQPASLRMLFTTPTRSVHHYWRRFDDSFMRPVFGGRGFCRYLPGSPAERDDVFNEPA